MGIRHNLCLYHIHFETDSFRGSAEVIEHYTEVLHGLSHDYYIISKSKVSNVFALYIDA